MSQKIRTDRWACPKCGRTEVRLDRTDWPRRTWECAREKCGHRWHSIESLEADPATTKAIVRRAIKVVSESLEEVGERYG